MTEVIESYNHKRAYEDWKKEAEEFGLKEISKINSDILLRYLDDMENGRNVARGSKKGARSPQRLNTLRIRMMFLMKIFEDKGFKDITKLSDEVATKLFIGMRNGSIKRKDGKPYRSSADYVKVFKAFWHWLQKIKRKEGITIEDITFDLDTTYDENSFVYIDKKDLDKTLKFFTPNEQTQLLFCFDTIIRSPKELMNVRVGDLSDDFKELTIRDESSKTFGRRVKILLCSDAVKEHIERNKLKKKDLLFDFSPPYFNRKMKKVFTHVFGDKLTAGGKPYSQVSLYDLRHSGACYWRKGAYQTKIDALMYRGGWSNLRMLNYYTKKLGMSDTIKEEDLLVNVDKTQLEKDLEKTRRDLDDLKKVLNGSIREIQIKQGIKPTEPFFKV